MMNRVDKFILFVFFLCCLTGLWAVAWAQEDVPEAIANRQPVEYKSGELRDPFQTYISKEKKADTQQQKKAELAQLETNLNELKVQGIIWGTKMPQAIIDNKVYIVGDKVENSEIVSINHKGVDLMTAAGVINLAAPGQGEVSSKDN